MTSRRFALLLLATVAAVGLATWSIATRQVPSAGRSVDEPLFAGLLDRLDDVAVIRLRVGDEKATVRRDGEVWRVEELSGFPADSAKVRDLARGLATLQLVEAKTARAERLDRLDLAEPGSVDEGGAREVVLEGAAGEPLARAWLGRIKPQVFGSNGGSGIYVRRADENQSWLARGEIEVPEGALEVARLPLVDVTESQVARVILDDGSVDPIIVSKASAAEPVFTVDKVPEGMKPNEERLGRLAAALDSLRMSGVAPAAAKPFPEDVRTARFETWDGFVVTITLANLGDATAPEAWARLSFAEMPATGETVEGTDPRPPKQRAAELQAQLEPWVFQLTGPIGAVLNWYRNDLVTPILPAGS